MSFYTTQLRFPVEQMLHDLKVPNDESNWPMLWERLGLADYPIWREDYRDELNKMIVRRYYFREIGFETFQQFAFMLKRTMREIMPYYNILYKALDEVKNPFYNRSIWHDEQWAVDIDRNTTDKIDSQETTSTTASSTGTTDVTDSSRNVYNDTPMNSLNSGDVENMRYATNVTFDKGESNTGTSSSSSSNGSMKNTANNVNTVDNDEDGERYWWEYGYTKSPYEIFLQLRDKKFNIDEQVLDELNSLFIGLWQ